MLDQNTDRMWYVIGAILIGAAIIYSGFNMFELSFKGVEDNFEKITVLADNAIVVEKDEIYYDTKIAELDLFIDNEKDWIIQNQDTQLGVIYMNNTGGISNVNPYFASLAAQGLLAGVVRDKDMDVVKKYLDWHTDQFILMNGQLSDYTVVDGELQISSDPDSIDAYIGVYLSLLVEFLEKGGEIAPDKLDNVIHIALDQLDALEKFGMTAVSYDYGVVYLMDNIEVLRGYYDLRDYVSDSSVQADLIGRINRMEFGMMSLLWNEVTGRYEIGLSQNGNVIRVTDESKLYPDAISQIFNVAYDIHLKGVNHSLIQYNQFNARVNWTDVRNNDPNGFFWSELFLIATKMKDVDRSEKYLASYRKETTKSRAYPFHTATAGWAIKGASELKSLYEIERNQLSME